jgi:hypothetical protein
MVMELVMPDQQVPFDVQALARFRRGNDRERDLLADLSRIGRNATPEFSIVGQQDSFKVKDRRGRQIISGKVDAFLKFTNAPIRTPPIPLEVKAWHSNIVDRLETFADVFEQPWTRSGGYQLLAYLYGQGLPLGFLVLDRSGLPKLLPVVLEENLDRMEEFLSKSESAVDHALLWVGAKEDEKDAALPPFIDDPSECRRCPFYGAACNPPLSAPDVQIFTEPAFEAMLQRWHDLKEPGQEWKGLDERLKKQLRGLENGLAGAFALRGSWSKYSRLDLPEDVRKQYTVVDPKGKYHLEIVRLPDATGAKTDGQAQGSSERSRGVLRTVGAVDRKGSAVDLPRRRRKARPAITEGGAQVLPFEQPEREPVKRRAAKRTTRKRVTA